MLQYRFHIPETGTEIGSAAVEHNLRQAEQLVDGIFTGDGEETMMVSVLGEMVRVPNAIADHRVRFLELLTLDGKPLRIDQVRAKYLAQNKRMIAALLAAGLLDEESFRSVARRVVEVQEVVPSVDEVVSAFRMMLQVEGTVATPMVIRGAQFPIPLNSDAGSGVIAVLRRMFSHDEGWERLPSQSIAKMVLQSHKEKLTEFCEPHPALPLLTAMIHVTLGREIDTVGE